MQMKFTQKFTPIFRAGDNLQGKAVKLMFQNKSNQVTFIRLVSSENYYRRPRIITLTVRLLIHVVRQPTFILFLIPLSCYC